MSRRLLILALLAGVTSTAYAGHKKKKARDDRRPTKSTKANMPRGFVWPPNRTMEAEEDRCEQKLDELGVSVKPAQREGRIVRPMALGDEAEIGGIKYTAVYSKHQVFDCQLVLALASFAPRLYELGVREVQFGSAFRWSKVRVGGKTKNILSRHALGIALDVVAFIDESGRAALVSRDYKRGDELLHDIERAVNDSGMFRVVLTPRNDPKSHSDHFHLEANPDYADAVEERPSS
jgi:hypothetical protein